MGFKVNTRLTRPPPATGVPVANPDTMKAIFRVSVILILLGITLIGAPQAEVGVVGAVILGLGIIGIIGARVWTSSKDGPGPLDIHDPTTR